jgi:hypothetical protein
MISSLLLPLWGEGGGDGDIVEGEGGEEVTGSLVVKERCKH